MEWGKKRNTIRHYDGLASIYDSLYSSEQDLKIKLALGAISLGDSDIVLDAGCGTGLLFQNIMDCVDLVVGLDTSRGLLKIASKRSKCLSKRSAFLICADADRTPFLNEVFDKVFAITLLQDMPYPNLTLREIMRVAKRDATIVVTGLKKSFSREEFARMLSDAALEFSIIGTDEQIRCHVAVCRKRCAKSTF